MAPSNEAANALQRNTKRPTPIRPIIPAVPLPYTQRRTKHAAVSKTAENSTQDSDVAVKHALAQAVPKPSPVVANGTNGSQASLESVKSTNGDQTEEVKNGEDSLRIDTECSTHIESSGEIEEQMPAGGELAQ